MNIENYKLVLAKIEADPSCWDQGVWHCGTQHCFGGWAQVLSGAVPNTIKARRDARIFLDLSAAEADYLFAPCRTREDFPAYLHADHDQRGHILYKHGYARDYYCDDDGYDVDGLDRNNKPREAQP